MRLPSVMKHDFSRTPQAVIPRSSFDRSHGYKTTFNAGYLIPFFVDEVIPGDTHHLRSTVFLRFATLLFPLMDNIHVDIQYFFVPMRILQDNFEKLMGYQKNPGDSTSYLFPTVTSTNTTDFGEGTIYDYFGIATKKSGVAVNSMPLRAYNKIWNDWYRSERLQNSVIENVDDGPDAVSDFALLRRGKRFDYFTSCLDAPQAGAATEIPIANTAPIILNPSSAPYSIPVVKQASNGAVLSGALSGQAATGYLLAGATGATIDLSTSHVADLSSAAAVTINDLRLAITTQQFNERTIRAGNRYQETLWSHYGVHGGDARLQRSELLSVYTHMMQVNAVPQTSGTGISSQTTPQANLAGYSTGVCHKAGFIKSFVEHGYIIGLISARADLTYQNGTDRMWFNSTKFDLYWPEFAHLGEQAVLQREIETLGTGADTGVFGYLPAWDHYRTKLSKITGLFRTNATGTLDSWHLAQDLSTPALNSTFIVENPPTTRVKATSGDPDFIMDTYHHLISARPLPAHGVPGLTRL